MRARILGRTGLALGVLTLLVWAWSYATAASVVLSLRDASVRRHRSEGPWQFLHALGKEGRAALFAHPPSRLEWALDLRPGRHRFRAEVGLLREDWRRSDGVTFRVALVEHGVERELQRFDLGPGPPRWQPISATFSTETRDSVLVLETANGDGGNALYDSALWAEPRVEALGPRPPWSWLLLWAMLVAVAVWASSRTKAAESRAWLWRGLRWIVVGAVIAGGLLLYEAFLRRFPELLPATAVERLPEGGFEWFATRTRDQIFDSEVGFLSAPHRTWRNAMVADAVALGRTAAAYWKPDATRVSIVTDGEGFRDSSGSTRSRIVVVGDSFVENGLVPDAAAWPEVVGERLGVPVRNLGVSGFSPQQSRIVLERFGLPRRPELVLFLLYEGNDVTDAGQYQEFVDSRMGWLEFLAKRRRASGDSQVTSRLDRSLAWALLRTTAFALHRRAGFAPASVRRVDNGLNPVCGEVSAATLCSAFLDRELLGETRSRDQWSSHPGWPLLLDAVAGAADASRSAGVRFIVVLAPSKASLYLPLFEGGYEPRAFDDYVGGFARRPAPPGLTWHQAFTENHGALNALLAESLADRGIDYVNLRPALAAKASKGRLLYFSFDTHWNVEGNQVVGELVAGELKRRGLPRPARRAS